MFWRQLDSKFFRVCSCYRLYFEYGKNLYTLTIRLKRTHIDFPLRFAPFKLVVDLFSKSHQWRKTKNPKNCTNFWYIWQYSNWAACIHSWSCHLSIARCTFSRLTRANGAAHTRISYNKNNNSDRSKTVLNMLPYTFHISLSLVPLFNEFIWTGCIKKIPTIDYKCDEKKNCTLHTKWKPYWAIQKKKKKKMKRRTTVEAKWNKSNMYRAPSFLFIFVFFSLFFIQFLSLSFVSFFSIYKLLAVKIHNIRQIFRTRANGIKNDGEKIGCVYRKWKQAIKSIYLALIFELLQLFA